MYVHVPLAAVILYSWSLYVMHNISVYYSTPTNVGPTWPDSRTYTVQFGTWLSLVDMWLLLRQPHYVYSRTPLVLAAMQ